MNARKAILHGVRQRLNRRQPLEASLQAGLDARGQGAVPGPQPAWWEEPATRFIAKTEAVHSSVDIVESAEAIPQAVVAYLQRQQLAGKAVAASHPLLADLSWPPGIEISWRLFEAGDEVSLSVAYAGIAESGTLAMVSSASSPASINFLPTVHIVILPKERILRQQEDLWALFKAESIAMPRALNLITGPSKTADVEQTIVYGAHGPGRLHILIIG